MPVPSAVYVISVAATLVGSHPQTLRTYERLGLVNPARTSGGVRLYSEQDIAVLHRVAAMSAAGISLPGIVRIFELESEVRALRAELQRVSSPRTSRRRMGTTS